MWTLDPETVLQITAYAGILTAVVGGIKKAAERLKVWDPPWSWLAWVPKLAQKVAHGWGPVLVSYVLPFLALVPEVVADGKLTMPEVSQLLHVFGIAIGSNVLYLISRFKLPKALRPD